MKKNIAILVASLACSLACSSNIDPPTPITTKIPCGDFECDAYLTCCNDMICVDTKSHNKHCGSCNNSCQDGQTCQNASCSDDSDSASTCQAPRLLCSTKCIDPSTNPEHCGNCNNKCKDNMQCVDKKCKCTNGFVDCDANPENGCESKINDCSCNAGQTRSCYTGPIETRSIGICKPGLETCSEDGTYWLDCQNEVLPTTEIPNNNIDEDCNGVIDNETDNDKDNWTVQNGDCCDYHGHNDCFASEPNKVNPSALEIKNNKIDDDCDTIIDNPPATSCSNDELILDKETSLTNAHAIELAKAMDICLQSDESTKKAGLVKATLSLSDGTSLPDPRQIAIFKTFGSKIQPQAANTLIALSSGFARGSEHTSLDDNMKTSVLFPQEFLSHHNNLFPFPTECPPPKNTKKAYANDSVKLSLTLRVPSNANAFQFKFRFFSKEYPRYACGEFNDFFLALLTSKHPDIPKDKNISMDSKSNPISVNNAFFTTCEPQTCNKNNFSTSNMGKDNCPKSMPCTNGKCGTCPDGSEDLLAYTKNKNESGATAWLTTKAPVIPGELITLDFHIFDTGTPKKNNDFGHKKDSLVLIDAFEWLPNPTKLITYVN